MGRAWGGAWQGWGSAGVMLRLCEQGSGALFSLGKGGGGWCYRLRSLRHGYSSCSEIRGGVRGGVGFVW